MGSSDLGNLLTAFGNIFSGLGGLSTLSASGSGSK
ncbi:hypothetical protein ABIA39_008740 [Nocardia sp. GAS34]